jgi:hypothetical protein
MSLRPDAQVNVKKREADERHMSFEGPLDKAAVYCLTLPNRQMRNVEIVFVDGSRPTVTYMGIIHLAKSFGLS